MNVKPKHILVFDLDNCLAEDASRMHLIKNGNRHGDLIHAAAVSNCNWNAYHQAGAHAAAHHVDYFHAAVEAAPRNCVVVFLTARPEAFATHTSAWLHRNGFASVRQWALVMRRNTDLDPSPVQKPRALARWLESEELTWDHVLCVYDDRRDVLAKFHALGVPTSLLAIVDRG